MLGGGLVVGELLGWVLIFVVRGCRAGCFVWPIGKGGRVGDGVSVGCGFGWIWRGLEW